MSKILEIIKQKLVLSFDKSKNLLIQSIKTFSNSKLLIHKAILTKSEIACVLREKSHDVVANLLIKKIRLINKLHLDSVALKNNECSHVRYRSTINRVVKFLKRDDLATNYLPKTTKAVKEVKAVKASKANKAVKAGKAGK